MLNAYACLFAFYLLAAALIAICMFASSLTESPIVAAVLGFGALMILYLAPMISAIIPTSAIASLICLGVLILVIALISYNMTKSWQISLGIGIILAIPSIVIYFLKPSLLEGLFPTIMVKLAVFEGFMQFIYGIFDITTVIYYLCIIVFFVFLTVESMEKKRWC